MITISNSLKINDFKTTNYNKILMGGGFVFDGKTLEFKKDGRVFYNGTQIYYGCDEKVACVTCDTCQTCAGTCYDCTSCTMCVDCHSCTTCDNCVNCNEHCNACTGCHGCTDDNNCIVNCYGWCTCCNECTQCTGFFGFFGGSCLLCYNSNYGCPCQDCNDSCYQFQTDPPRTTGGTGCNGGAGYSSVTHHPGCEVCDTCLRCNACNGVCTSCFGCYVCDDRCYSND